METVEPDGSGIVLLLVEDEPDTCEVLSTIIRYRYPDMRVFTAGNGDAGIESFKLNQPAIVITDVNMPVINGITMAAEIKSLCPSTEIIALTAFTNTEYLMQAIEIGISHYVLKPVDTGQLFTIIDKTLAIIRSEQLIAQQNRTIRELNDELLLKTAQLEAANRELETFNYTVAHDLRSPIASINLSQILLEVHSSTMNAACKGHLQVIKQEMNNMNTLIGVLLNFSVNSQRQADKKWTNLSEIAHEIRDSLQAREPRRRVKFHIAEGVKGYCDPGLSRIILENLLGNAWKYSAGKQVARIEFGTINREEDLVYFVRDNGAGFDQQEADKLFVPFQRLQNNVETEGFGIGLATVFRIIKRHGGRIWAEGKTGKGATFYFTL